MYQNSKSSANNNRRRFTGLKDFFFVKPNVVQLIRALQYGPIIVAHKVSSAMKFYKRGVFDGEGCENMTLNDVNHAAIVVGYNLNHRQPYFRVRSSWGKDWGEFGHYRISIGQISDKSKGTCFISGTPFMVFPYVKSG